MSDDVAIVIENGVQILRFARADKKNALTTAMYKSLIDAIHSGDMRDDVGAHVFVGSGGAFCAGNDIGDFMANTTDSIGDVPYVMDFVRLLPEIKKPLIAAVDGPAVGIGTTMLFHCDLVYASPGAYFSTPFLDLGLVPEAGSSLTMPTRMGYARAFEMLILGESFSAQRMMDAGLLNGIVPADQLEETAFRAAQRLAKKPREALRIARQLMRPDNAHIRQVIDTEARFFAERLASREARAAFKAFMAR